jgi:hypothetical protein
MIRNPQTGKNPSLGWVEFPALDLDSTCHPDADPDSDFYLLLIWIQLSILMRIRIQILASK